MTEWVKGGSPQKQGWYWVKADRHSEFHPILYSKGTLWSKLWEWYPEPIKIPEYAEPEYCCVCDKCPEIEEKDGNWVVACDHCKLSAPTGSSKSKAVKIWNRLKLKPEQ